MPLLFKSLLVVHGYRAYRLEGALRLTDQCIAVCREAAQFNRLYDCIALIGGWQDKSLLPDETNATAMHRELVRRGVRADKEIHVVHQETWALDYLPPRETAEEGILLKLFLDHECVEGREYSVYVVADEVWLPRIRTIYHKLGIRIAGVISVRSEAGLFSRFIQYGLRIISAIDPLGEGVITGLSQRFIRAHRTRRLTGSQYKPLVG